MRLGDSKGITGDALEKRL